MTDRKRAVRRRTSDRVTPEKKERFLNALRAGLSVTTALRAGEFSHQTAYRIRKTDEAFRNAWEEAIEAGTDRLEDVVLQLGVQDKNITALIFMLKARRPEKFRDYQKVDLTNSDGTLGLFSRAMQALELPDAPTPDKLSTLQ